MLRVISDHTLAAKYDTWKIVGKVLLSLLFLVRTGSAHENAGGFAPGNMLLFEKLVREWGWKVSRDEKNYI